MQTSQDKMVKHQKTMKKINVGDKVTCRPDNKLRGAEVTKVFSNGDILVDCWCPYKKSFFIKSGKYQLSKLWNEVNEI